ncbi:MAG: hypothetical protein HQM09_21820 [Candidatus Riflebacteria bacterium]|nr:hypothetical protein [Candidatus Riflebacteria bacterium]
MENLSAIFATIKNGPARQDRYYRHCRLMTKGSESNASPPEVVDGFTREAKQRSLALDHLCPDERRCLTQTGNGSGWALSMEMQ